jgi:cobalamin-dependent methionine synthase I
LDTVLESKTKAVVIGPDRPFVIIGERINPTGRKLLAPEMAAGNYERVRNDATDQVECEPPQALNGTFLAMMIANGLTAAITNPSEPEIKRAILAADLFMGHDENCVAWITAARGLEPRGDGSGDRAARRQRREGRRSRGG